MLSKGVTIAPGGGAKKAAVLFFFRLLDADGHGVNVAGPVGWVQPAW